MKRGAVVSRTIRGLALCTLAVGIAGLCLQAIGGAAANAEDKPVMAAAFAEKEVTLTGKVVDLQCFMTGKHEGDDPAKCAATCIKNGVPCGLETAEGLVILGHGMEGPAKLLNLFAMANVQVKGKLYEKGGVKYLDVIAVTEMAGKPAVEPKPEEPQE